MPKPGGDRPACGTDIERRFGDGQAEALRSMHHLLPIRVTDEKQELLAPVTAEIIALPENGRKPPCELSQRCVTGTMAIEIMISLR